MIKKAHLFLIIQVIISHAIFSQNLPNASSNGTSSTTSTSFVNVTDASVTVDVTNANKVLLIATLTSKTSSGASTGGYRIADNSDNNINSGEFLHTHSGKDGIGTIVHIFDVSSLSGNRTYAFQHKTTAQTLNTSATITAIVLYDGEYQLTNDIQQLGSPIVVSDSNWSSVVSKTNFNLPAQGGIYVAASVQNQKTSGGTAVVSGEWILQYKKSSDSEWKNMNYPIFRAPLGEQIGMASLVGSLPNNTDAGNYDFRLAHRRITAPSEFDLVTQACNMVVVALGYENGYFPILSSTKPTASTTSTSLVPVIETVIKPQSNTDIFVHTQYGLRSNGTTEPCTHDIQLKKRGIEISKSINYLKYIANNNHRCSGSTSVIFEDMEMDSVYNIDFRHASRPSRSMTTSETFMTIWGLNRSSLPFVSPITVYASEGLSSASYSTIKAAFDDINSGLFRGEITIHVNDNTTETASCLINASGTGSTNYSSILIYPTSSNLSINSNIALSLIHLNGANNITIDGRVNQIGEASLDISNTSTHANARTIRFENSAQNNTIKYVRIKGSSVGDVIFFSNSSTGTGNNNNTIEHCYITNAGQRSAHLIYSAGTAGRRNSGNIIRNNNFFNFLSTDRFSYGINIVSNSENWLIDGNHFYDTEIIAPSGAMGYSCIRINTTDVNNYTISNNYFGGTEPYCGGSKWTINASTPHFMRIISLNLNNTSGTSVVSNNTIQGFDYTSTGGNPFDAIYLYEGAILIENNIIGDSTGVESIILRAPNPYLKANISGGGVSSVDIIGTGTGFTVAPEISFNVSSGSPGSGATATTSINGNGEITSITITNAGSGYISEPQVRIQNVSQTYSTFHGIWIRGVGTKTIRNNIIGSIKTIGSDAFVYGFEGIYENSGFVGTTEISNNIIGSLGTENNIHCSSNGELAATGQRLYAIYSQNDGNTYIKNNNIGNITNAYSGNNNVTQTIGIQVNRGNNFIENNFVFNLKTYTKSTGSASAASICGISINRNTAGLNHTIKNNRIDRIYNLSADARVDAYGIYFSGSNADWSEISGNRVEKIEISSSNIGSSIDGIVIYGGKTHFHNNIVHLGKDFDGKCLIYGVFDYASWTSDLNCYFNTVIIEGSVSGATSSSFAFYNRTSTGTDRNVKNNLFINTRSGGTSGKHYAIRIGTVSNLFIDYNNYYAPNGVIGWLTVDKNTLDAWKTTTSQDVNSYNDDPQFVGSGENHEPFYPSIPQNGVTGTGIEVDYTGQSRSETTPKIGALETNEIVWQGGTSTDFNTGSNWVGGIVPGSGASIRFADTPDNHCVLDQNRSFGSITNSSDKNLNLNGKKATVKNTISFSSTGKIVGNTTGSTLELTGTINQTLNGNSLTNNILDTLIINNSAQVNLSNNIIIASQLKLTKGEFSLNEYEIELNGTIQSDSAILIGGNNSSISIDGDIPSFNIPELTLKKLSLNTTNSVILSGNVIIQDSLILSNGSIDVNAKTFTMNGRKTFRTNGSINASTASSTVIFNNDTSITIGDGFFGNNVANLIIKNGGIKSQGNISITESIDLQSNNPNSSTGLLSMLNDKELTLASLAEVQGIGDITGIVSRYSFIEGAKYTFNNKNAHILFSPGSTTLPNYIKVKLSIGSSPSWKTDAINRIYELIQHGGDECIATFRASYLDSELGDNTETNLSLWSEYASADPSGPPLDNGKSNYNITENWIELADVNLMYFPPIFGHYEISMANTSLISYTWTGIHDTDWNRNGNWSTDAVPSETSSVVIPDAMTTNFSPSLPNDANTIIKDIRFEAGAVLNSGATDNAILSLTHNIGTWNNNGGTFNPGNSTVKFIRNGNSTISGTTQFHDIEISDTTILSLAAGTHLKINGEITIVENGLNRGILRTVIAGNTTVEYNGGNQTIVIPNTSTNRYSNLILSGTGTKSMSNQNLEINQNLNITGTATFNANASLSILGDISIDENSTFNTNNYNHSIKGNFENNGTFTSSEDYYIVFNGDSLQEIFGEEEITFHKLEINNPNHVEIEDDITIEQELKLNEGRLKLSANTVSINGTISKTNGQLEACSQCILKFGGTNNIILNDNLFFGTPELKQLIIDRSGGVQLGNQNLTILEELLLEDGSLITGINNLILSGNTLSRTSGNIDASSGTFTFNNSEAIIVPASTFGEDINNLSITGEGGITLQESISVNGTLNLYAENPSSTNGILHLTSSNKLTMGANSETVGIGDVTGIVRRISFAGGTNYTFGSTFSTISFNYGATTLPDWVEVKIEIGNAPWWKSEAINRVYDIIQSGGNNSFATFRARYLSSELNSNTESELSIWSQHDNIDPYNTPLDNGRSNYNLSDKWLELANVNLMYFPDTYGLFEISMANTTLETHTWTGATSTDWETATNWSTNSIPTENSSVVIPDAFTTLHSPSLPAEENTTLWAITLDYGAILNSGASDNAILSLTHSVGTWNNNGGTFNPGNSTVEFIRFGNSTISGTTQFNNIVISDSTVLWMTADATIKINGSITIHTNDTISGSLQTTISGETTVEYNGGNQTIIIPDTSSNNYYHLILSGTGTKTLPNRTLEIKGDLEITGTASLTLTDDILVIGNIEIGDDANFDSGNQDFKIKGNLTNNGTLDFPNDNIIEFCGTTPQIISGNTSTNFKNLKVNNAEGVSLNSPINVNTELILTSGNLNINSGLLGINGIISGSGKLSTTELSSISMGGSSAQTLNDDIFVSPPSLKNLIINNSIGVSLGNQIITIIDTLNLTQGSLNLQNKSLNIDGHIIRTTGSINTNVGTNLSLGNNTSEMELPSNLFATSPADFRNLQIDRAGGLKLGNQAVQIDNKLILSNGIINTNSNHFIFTKNASVGTALDNNIAGSSSSYIDGCVRKIGNTAFTFPIGKSNEFAPAGISAADGGGNDTHFFDACYFNENPNTSYDINELQEGLKLVSSVEYWTISRTGTNNVHVTLSWDERSGTIRNSDEIIIAHWNSVDGKWENKNQTQKTGDNNSGNATSELISDFSPFTLGSTSNQNILPVELSYFKANCQSESIKLTWQTLTETNNEYFILERFVNNKWEEISKISGAGNSNIPVGYSYLDFNNGENIYRLQQKDFDGKIRSIALQSIECSDANEFYINLFPNPSREELRVISNYEILNETYIIKNSLNQIVQSGILNESGQIDIRNLNSGIYFLIFESLNKKMKIIKQ